jgi:hypothetical protein
MFVFPLILRITNDIPGSPGEQEKGSYPSSSLPDNLLTSCLLRTYGVMLSGRRPASIYRYALLSSRLQHLTNRFFVIPNEQSRHDPEFPFWHPERQQYTPCRPGTSEPSGIGRHAFRMQPTCTSTRFSRDFLHTLPSPWLLPRGFLLPAVDSTLLARWTMTCLPTNSGRTGSV